MTKIMMNIDKQNNIMFDCQNHADNYDVCTIISTLCGVLLEACQRCMDDNSKFYVDGEKISLREKEKADLREHSWRVLDDFFDIHVDRGNIRIDVCTAQNDTLEVFETVYEVMKQAARQHPEFIKIY